MRFQPRFTLIGLGSLMLAVAGCVTDPVEERTAVPALSVPERAEVEVIVDDRAFQTEEVTVSIGDTVTWVNEDTIGHTITHGTNGAPATTAEFDQPLSVDAVVSYTFEAAGTYPVTCKIHPDMQMTVIVDP